MKTGRINELICANRAQHDSKQNREVVVAVVDRFVCLALSPNGDNEYRSSLTATTLHVNTTLRKLADG